MKTYIAIGFKAGDENVYRYVKNNPGHRVDPSGLRDPFAPRGTSRGHRGRPTLMRDGSVPIISSNIDPGVLQQHQNEGRLDFSNIDPYNPPNKLWGGIPAQQIPDSLYKNWREELDRQGDEEARRYREENREEIRRQEEEARKREEEIERLVDEKMRELRNKYWGTRQEFRNRIDHMNQLIKSIQNIKNLIAKYIKSKPDGCDRDDPKLVYYFERMEFYSKKYLEEYIEVANYIMSGNASTEDMLIEATKLDTLGTVGLQALQPPQIVDLQKQAIKSVGLQAKRTQRNCEYAQNTIDCANLALALYGVGQVTTTVAREGSKATIKITTSSLAGYAAAEGADMTMDALGFDIETKEKVFIGINIATLFLAWRNARCDRKRSTTKTEDGSVEGAVDAPRTVRGAPTNLGPVGSKAPKQVAPGVRELEGHYIDDLGRSQPWRAHYDEYGRLIGRTDYNAGNRAQGIPDIHHHRYEWGPGRTPHEVQGHIPGEFTP